MIWTKKTLGLLAAALVLGVFATWIANRWLTRQLAPGAQASNATLVVVAAVPIQFGQKLEPAHLRLVSWPVESLPDGYFNDLAKVSGKVANQTIAKGVPVLKDQVVDEVNGSALAAMVAPGKRAVTVRVNDVIGVAGFILPGNRVDVVAARKDRNQRAETRTILRDLKVLAVDQTASNEKGQPVVVRAVTLEMDPKQAEELVKATEEGTVQLALRNPNEPALRAPKIRRAQTSKPEPDTVMIIRGNETATAKTEF